MNNITYILSFSENPSLLELHDFILNNFHLLTKNDTNMFDENTIKVIDNYIYGRNTAALHSLLTTNNSNIDIQSKNKVSEFYLGGHYSYKITEPITEEMISLVQKKIDSTDLSQCWGMEIYSVMEHNKRFENFKKFYYNYKEFITHYKYSPDNIGYIEAKEHFENSINNTN